MVLSLTVFSVGLFFCLFLRDYREMETPGTIPNPEAKSFIVDNTAVFNRGNVEHCVGKKQNPLNLKGVIMFDFITYLIVAVAYLVLAIHKL